MMLGCGCNQLRGLMGAEVNGVPIASTSDPVGTPVVMNYTPGQNLQQAASVVPTGTLSSSGQACNTDGGYVWNAASGQCVQANQPTPQAQTLPSGMTTTVDPSTGSIILVPITTVAPTNPTNPILGTTAAQPTVAAATSSSDVMIGSFDLSTFLSQYGLWLAAGVGALLLLSSSKR